MDKTKTTNPHGANQWQPDPRQALCLQYYRDPDSPSWSNAFQSAIRAGYSDNSAKDITSQPWFRETAGTFEDEIVKLAEDNLKTFLADKTTFPKIRADLTKFSLERLNKQKYSSRSELTGANGEKLDLVSGVQAQEIVTALSSQDETEEIPQADEEKAS